jgi:hypothetical protein
VSAIDDLRKRFSKTHFDVVSKGVEGGVALVTDLRLKFGPHSGKLLSQMAATPSDRMYVRNLYKGFSAVPSATFVVRALIEKLLDEA